MIDDGIATGATTRAALRVTSMRKPKKLILAVPVAPTDSLAAMRQEADDVVCLEAHTDLGAISSCDRDRPMWRAGTYPTRLLDRAPCQFQMSQARIVNGTTQARPAFVRYNSSRWAALRHEALPPITEGPAVSDLASRTCT